jgi:hypothetical protein
VKISADDYGAATGLLFVLDCVILHIDSFEEFLDLIPRLFGGSPWQCGSQVFEL